MKHQQQSQLIILFSLGLLLAIPTIVFSDELEDVTIQVIGLDEIPENTLERIPIPSPNFGSLIDIHQGIITRQAVISGEKIDDSTVSTPQVPSAPPLLTTEPISADSQQ